MAKVYLNPFGKFNIRADGSGAGGAQVLDGQCSQKRVNIAVTGGFDNASPALTVGNKTDFIQIVTNAVVLVWAGKFSEDAQVKQDFAIAIDVGTYTFEVSVGDSVYVWTA